MKKEKHFKLEFNFDGGDYCAVANFTTGLNVDFLKKNHFNHLRGDWSWFEKQLGKCNLNNIGYIDMIAVHRNNENNE